jgi:hypothetical protein
MLAASCCYTSTHSTFGICPQRSPSSQYLVGLLSRSGLGAVPAGTRFIVEQPGRLDEEEFGHGGSL